MWTSALDEKDNIIFCQGDKIDDADIVFSWFFCWVRMAEEMSEWQ